MAKVALKKTGMSLEGLVIGEFHDSIMIPPGELEEDEGIKKANPHAIYQGKPIEFCKEVLKIEFTEEVEDMITAAQFKPSTFAQSANGVGKTFAAACFIIYFFLVYDDAQVYTGAAPPIDNLILLLWGEIGAIVERLPHLFREFTVSLSGMKIGRNKRSFLVGLAIPQAQDQAQIKARFAGKHAPHLLFVFDEGDGVPDAVYKAVESCMSGGFARLLILFNPRAEGNPVHRMGRAGEGYTVKLTAFNHPNVITGEDKIPGAVDRETTVRRIHLWTEALASDEQPGTDCFKVPDFLKGYVAHKRSGEPLPPLKLGWRRIVDGSFSYMVLGEYPTQAENQLISGAWVEAAHQRHALWVAQYGTRAPQGIHPFMSYDVAELGKDRNVIWLWYGSWVSRAIVWGGVDTEVSGNKAADLYFRNACSEANVDATGIGAGAWARMKHRGCNANRIMVQSRKDLEFYEKTEELDESEFSGFDSVRSQMLWGLREWLRTDKGAMLPPDEELDEELIIPTYGKDNKERLAVCKTDTMKEKLHGGRSPDKLMALAIRWAVRPVRKSGVVEVDNYIYQQASQVRSKGSRRRQLTTAGKR